MPVRSTPRASTAEVMGPPLELPPYEPQIAPLTASSKRKVDSVIKAFHSRHLKIHLTHAAGALSETAGDTNDRLTEAKARLEKVKRRRREKEEKRLREVGEEGNRQDKEAGGEERDSAEREAENDSEREEKLARFEQLVKKTTRNLEGGMRSIVDSEVQVDNMLDLLTELLEENSTETQNEPQPRARRSRRNQDNGDTDMDDDEEDREAEPPAAVEVIPASRTIADGLVEKKRKWEALSLAQRYGTNNSYKQFYRVLHESKHSGVEVPPLPPTSAWFQSSDASREPGSQSRRRKKKRSRPEHGVDGTFEEDGADEDDQQTPSPSDNDEEGDNDDDEDEGDEEEEEEEPTQEATQDAPSDDEIAVRSEKFSITCPLTLQSFKDPVSSTKCPHSFERSAIESMISRSRQNTFVPESSDSSRGRNMRCVKCPVCNVLITLRDLRRDPVLIRRVKRAGRIAALEEENDNDDGYGDEDVDMDDDSVMVNKSRVARGGREVVVKSERVRSPSRIPDTQMDE